MMCSYSKKSTTTVIEKNNPFCLGEITLIITASLSETQFLHIIINQKSIYFVEKCGDNLPTQLLQNFHSTYACIHMLRKSFHPCRLDKASHLNIPFSERLFPFTFCASVYRSAKWKKSKRVWKTSVHPSAWVFPPLSLQLPLSSSSCFQVEPVLCWQCVLPFTSLKCVLTFCAQSCRRSGEAVVSTLF